MELTQKQPIILLYKMTAPSMCNADDLLSKKEKIFPMFNFLPSLTSNLFLKMRKTKLSL